MIVYRRTRDFFSIPIKPLSELIDNKLHNMDIVRSTGEIIGRLTAKEVVFHVICQLLLVMRLVCLVHFTFRLIRN